MHVYTSSMLTHTAPHSTTTTTTTTTPGSRYVITSL